MIHRIHVRLDEPAYYCITVLGQLDKELCYRLSHLEMHHSHNEHGEELSTLCGVMSDQAALIGVLVQLYNRGLCLMALERTKSTPPDQAEQLTI